jgi:hypothetical protein
MRDSTSNRCQPRPRIQENACEPPRRDPGETVFLDISADRFKELGFENVLKPVKVSCADHEGARTGRIQTWDGKNWQITSDWYVSDDNVIAPMVKDAAAKYAAEKNIAAGCLTN